MSCDDIERNAMNVFRKARGRIRLLFGFCPKCNSDAPRIDHCWVCCGWRWAYDGKPTRNVKEMWWKRFISSNH